MTAKSTSSKEVQRPIVAKRPRGKEAQQAIQDDRYEQLRLLLLLLLIVDY